jgi:geranylgeranyl diphosphate synthase type II
MNYTGQDFLKEKKIYFEALLHKQLSCVVLEKRLQEACLYSLSNGGKRLRPLIVYLIQQALDSQENVDPAALALEFFHTASLIADDLPCMDNAKERRNKPTLHRLYDEATAVLASYALIVAAFEKIHEATEKSSLKDKNERGSIALKQVCHAAGIQGATGGQYLDLFADNIDKDLLETIIYKKTVVLFEVAFSLGWLYSGGALEVLDDVKKAGRDLGFAFQLIDDVLDQTEDNQKTKPSNMTYFVGEEKTKEKIFELLRSCEISLEKTGLNSRGFLFLLGTLKDYLKIRDFR